MGSQTQRQELGLTGALESMPGKEDLWGSNPLPPEDITQSRVTTQKLRELQSRACYSVSALPQGYWQNVIFPQNPSCGV